MQNYFEAPKATLIYVFRINDAAHAGCLKVGETTLDDESANILTLQPNASALNRAARHRIDQYTQTAGIAYELLYTEAAVYIKGMGVAWFNDKEVHQVLLRSGIKRKEFKGVEAQGTEWFTCDLETVKQAIHAVKEGRQSLTSDEITTDRSPIVFRPEQRDAIDKANKLFKKANRMLWNAKMRFGKTLSALQVVKEQQFRRTLILTHRPVVNEGWYEDFSKIFYDSPQYVYGSRVSGETFDNLEKQYAKQGKSYVYFASMQDLRGSEQVGGKFDKNHEIFDTPWDFIIVDEAHEGTQTSLGQAVMKELTKPTTKVLELSGTPFNLLGDYKEDEIYTWDYVMEQRAKADWDITHCGDPNPYACLPQLHIYTYDLGRLLNDFADEDVAFNFREFFRTADDGAFIHEADVQSFLNLLTREDEESMYPFANRRYRATFRHTLWMLPGVKAARAMSQLLQAHPVFSQFHVVNVAGEGDEDEENGEALRMVEEAIGPDPDTSRTITLSCGRLTTGVSVKAWTGVLMLSGSFNTAASAYMQTIFRVQTPATINGRVKQNCYVFDFAPDRTLQVLATVPRVSTKAGQTTDAQKQALAGFLNFCPVIAIEGSRMEKMDVKRMLTQLKRAYVERVVRNGFEDSCLYNDELLKLTDIEIEEFQQLKGIIGQTRAIGNAGNIDINQQGLTNEEYEEKKDLERKKKKDLTPEELKRLEELKARKKLKEDAVSILRGISIRMPLLIYGAEIKDEDTELTIDNFTTLIDPQSWEEFMPRGVTKQRFNQFKRYYDPEIFSAAGKRIRAMARAADHLTIEERISRIASIFATFRNPDKETVLTPWRVVNMHLSDCLGGYTFFREGFPQEGGELDEPRYVDRGGVTDEVYSPTAHLLEINSKSGLYPLLLAYNVYRRRCREAMFSPETLQDHQALWDKTVSENIYVVCKTPMAKSITRRTLLGFRDGKTNMWAPDDLINKIKNQPELFIERVHKLVGNDMKINAVVGNPPYQVLDGGNKASATPVYNLFVDIAKQMKPSFVSMIMPAKWYSGGKGLDTFRSTMLSDKHIAGLYDFVDPHDCFANVDVAGGICYFLWSKDYKGRCRFVSTWQGKRDELMRDLNEFDTFIRFNQGVDILEKTQRESTTYMDGVVSSRKPFGLTTDVKPTESGNLVLRYNGGKGAFPDEEVTVKREWIPKWKIIVSYLTNDHAGFFDNNGQRRIISTLEKLCPQEICTETYLVAGAFDTEAEADNLMKYIRSKFVRFLMSLVTSTQHIARANFRLVPLQDFSPQSDIDWSKSVAEIDRQLYAKYALTPEEVSFIEQMIRPME